MGPLNTWLHQATSIFKKRSAMGVPWFPLERITPLCFVTTDTQHCRIFCYLLGCVQKAPNGAEDFAWPFIRGIRIHCRLQLLFSCAINARNVPYPESIFCCPNSPWHRSPVWAPPEWLCVIRLCSERKVWRWAKNDFWQMGRNCFDNEVLFSFAAFSGSVIKELINPDWLAFTRDL